MNLKAILGGSPLGVFIYLVVFSLIVGIVLKAFGLHPFELVIFVKDFAVAVYNLGFASFGWIFDYFIAGAVIVIPIWLVSRIIMTLFGKGDAKS